MLRRNWRPDLHACANITSHIRWRWHEINSKITLLSEILETRTVAHFVAGSVESEIRRHILQLSFSLSPVASRSTLTNLVRKLLTKLEYRALHSISGYCFANSTKECFQHRRSENHSKEDRGEHKFLVAALIFSRNSCCVISS